MYRGKFANNASQSSPRRSKKGLIIFLCFYILLVALFLLGIHRLLAPLPQKLSDYEAAQLEHQCPRFFEELFSNPDWKELYIRAGATDTAYEGAEAYVAYMEAKTQGRELTYREVYNELPGVHLYHVFLGDEKVAAFRLTGGENSASELPQWTLDGVDIFFERRESVTVEKKPEHTVYINGVALDDSHTIRTTSTKAEEYLPEGVHGYRLEQQYIEGLLLPPEVLVLDEHGEAVAMTQDTETGIYTPQPSEEPEMTDEEKTLVRNAAVADAQFSVGGVSASELRKYFNASSQVYQDIIDNPVVVQKHQSHSIDEASVVIGEYCQYSEMLFSVNVKMTVNVIRKNGSLKVYPMDKTYFFTCNDDGKYLVTGYTNEKIHEQVEQVRLTFVLNEEESVSFMVPSNADMVSVPELPIPEGEKPVGWATKTEGDTITMTVRLMPDGSVLGDLEPMTLYPVCQPMPNEEM